MIAVAVSQRHLTGVTRGQKFPVHTSRSCVDATEKQAAFMPAFYLAETPQIKCTTIHVRHHQLPTSPYCKPTPWVTVYCHAMLAVLIGASTWLQIMVLLLTAVNSSHVYWYCGPIANFSKWRHPNATENGGI